MKYFITVITPDSQLERTNMYVSPLHCTGEMRSRLSIKATVPVRIEAVVTVADVQHKA